MQKNNLVKIDKLPIGTTFVESDYYALRIDGSVARGFECEEDGRYYEHVKYEDGREEWWVQNIFVPIYGGMGFC